MVLVAFFHSCTIQPYMKVVSENIMIIRNRQKRGVLLHLIIKTATIPLGDIVYLKVKLPLFENKLIFIVPGWKQYKEGYSFGLLADILSKHKPL